MRHLVHLFVIICALAFGCRGGGAAATAGETNGYATMYLEEHAAHDRAATADRLSDADAANRHSAAAVLSDAQDIYRICSSRPQRILPSGASKPARLLWEHLQHFYYKPHNKPLLGGRKASHRHTPFATEAPCDYYVIALRHIIR